MIMKQWVIGCFLTTLVCLTTNAQAGRWWKIVHNPDVMISLDLDSFRTFQDNDGLEISTTWVRLQYKKAQTIQHPITGKGFITSGSAILAHVKCDSGQLKFADMIFEDRKFNSLLTLSNYPELMKNLQSAELPLGKFYYTKPDSNNYKFMYNICQIQQELRINGLTPADLQLDKNGQIIIPNTRPPNHKKYPSNPRNDAGYDLEI